MQEKLVKNGQRLKNLTLNAIPPLIYIFSVIHIYIFFILKFILKYMFSDGVQIVVNLSKRLLTAPAKMSLLSKGLSF